MCSHFPIILPFCVTFNLVIHNKKRSEGCKKLMKTQKFAVLITQLFTDKIVYYNPVTIFHQTICTHFDTSILITEVYVFGIKTNFVNLCRVHNTQCASSCSIMINNWLVNSIYCVCSLLKVVIGSSFSWQETWSSLWSHRVCGNHLPCVFRLWFGCQGNITVSQHTPSLVIQSCTCISAWLP